MLLGISFSSKFNFQNTFILFLFFILGIMSPYLVSHDIVQTDKERERERRTDRRTDGRMNGRTDGRTYHGFRYRLQRSCVFKHSSHPAKPFCGNASCPLDCLQMMHSYVVVSFEL
jgi:hypothetical protein